ncbi:cupin domain-containing protein, partial [Acinetobacter baumannii]|nr:cupin domain-containing protein [Acinetobacter baumannii]
MNVKAVTFVTSLFISMGVPAMDKKSVTAFQTVKKANQQQVITGLDNIFTGQVAIKPLTDVTDSINASSAYVSFNA